MITNQEVFTLIFYFLNLKKFQNYTEKVSDTFQLLQLNFFMFLFSTFCDTKRKQTKTCRNFTLNSHVQMIISVVDSFSLDAGMDLVHLNSEAGQIMPASPVSLCLHSPFKFKSSFPQFFFVCL